MNRTGALLWVIAVASGCNTETLSFDDSDAVAPDVFQVAVTTDATTDASLPRSSDATLDVEADANPRSGNRGPPDADNAGSIAQCRTESDCAHYRLHCAVSDASPGICVECVKSEDCLDSKRPVCDPGLHRCVECDGMNDCPTGETCVVDPTHTCIPACVNQTCPRSNYHCDTTRNVCLGCTNDNGCNNIGQHCDLVSGQCGDCASDTDCHGSLPKCDRITSRCVECLRDSDCGRGICFLSTICIPSTEPGDARTSE